MFIVRGVNIYPSHISQIFSLIQGIGSEYQIILDRREDGKDYMTIKVERMKNGIKQDDISLSKKIEEQIRKELLVSGKVEIVDYGSLPRTDRKTKRVFDNR
jgi:phenylacetate-CoA ligase